MTTEEKREQVILALTDLLRHTHYTIQIKAKKKPQGVKVIIETTQESLESLAKQVFEKRNMSEVASAQTRTIDDERGCISSDSIRP